MKTKFTFMLALLAFHSSLSFGQTSAVPGTISYQGTVYNPDGSLLGGGGTPVNRTVIFRIWDSSSATTAANLLYSESQTVTISEGNFSVLVGNGIPNDTQTYTYSEISKHSSASPAVSLADVFNGAARYLSVTVANASAISTSDAEISPRQQIVSSAFAFRSKFAEALGTSASGSSLQVLDNGNIGVGNASPPSALTVTGANSSYAAPQLLITATDTTERLRLGVNDTGTGTGFIQAWKEGSGSQNLTLNSEGGNVGIGVASPLAKLHVNGTASFRTGTASDGYLSITPGTPSTAGYLSWYKPGGLRQGALGGEGKNVKLLLENSADFTVLGGNVGIGVTGPGNPLTIQKTLGSNDANNSQHNLQLQIQNGIGAKSLGIGVLDDGTSVLQAKEVNKGDGYANILINPVAGNVGIGNSNPAYKLHVSGTAAVSSNLTVGQYLTVGDRVSTKSITATGAVSFQDTLAVSGKVAIRTTNTSQGDLSVGTGGFVSVGSRNNAAGFARMRYENAGRIYLEAYNTNLNNGQWRGFSMDGNNDLDWSSDRRLKKNIVDAEPMLDRLMQLPFRRYQYKSSTNPNERPEFGVIAQEVEPLFPDLVGQGEDGIMTVGYTSFATIACKTIQELKIEKDNEIDDLRTDLTQKTAEIADLNARLLALEKLVGDRR